MILGYFGISFGIRLVLSLIKRKWVGPLLLFGSMLSSRYLGQEAMSVMIIIRYFFLPAISL